MQEPCTKNLKFVYLHNKVPKATIRYFWNQTKLISSSCPDGRTGIWRDFTLLGETGNIRDVNSNLMNYSSYCLERIGHSVSNESQKGKMIPNNFPLVAIVCTKLKKDVDDISKIVIPIMLFVSLTWRQLK